MPASALRYTEIDHCVGLGELPKLLVRLTLEAPAATPCSSVDGAAHEQEILLAQGNGVEHLAKIGTPSKFVCPDCHGGLWEVSDVRPPRFRCHTGHAFTIRTLQHTLATASEEALWSARRAIQERLILVREMGRSTDDPAIADASMEGAAARLQDQLNELERLMERGPDPIE
jgi:two-component system chemotaxis response regulator CheB